MVHLDMGLVQENAAWRALEGKVFAEDSTHLILDSDTITQFTRFGHLSFIHQQK